MIFDGSDIRVTQFRGITNYTVAFFSHHFSAPNIRREWGRRFAEKYAIDALFFAVSRNHWWNTREFGPAVAAAKTSTDQRIVGYGISMGGTGALLAFTEAIAIVPQATVDPVLVPWEDRWRADRANLNFMRVPAKARGRATVILDPLNLRDMRHAEMIGGRRVTFPGMGHLLAQRLAAEHRLSGLILGLVERRDHAHLPPAKSEATDPIASRGSSIRPVPLQS